MNDYVRKIEDKVQESLPTGRLENGLNETNGGGGLCCLFNGSWSDRRVGMKKDDVIMRFAIGILLSGSTE